MAPRDDHAPELQQLRQQLDHLDRKLLETVAERLNVVARIGALKAGVDRPVFDREREQKVFERARDNAAAVGVDPALAEGLMGQLVNASHATQAAVSRERMHAENSHRFLIVGGGGLMGARLGRALRGRGHRVDILERDDGQDRAHVVSQAEIVMLSVPMAHAVDVALELGPHVAEGALLCDINSLKADICAAMGASFAGEVLGLHPMFGPTVHALTRQKVVTCAVRPGPLGAWLVKELGAMGLEAVASTPAEHDKMMAIVQVLTHFSTLVMGEALRRTGVPVERSLAFTSPIYRLELAFVGRLYAQDPDLYAAIEMTNPAGAEMRDHFKAATAAVADLISRGDRDAFRQMFEGVGAYFGDFDNEAMRLSDLIIDTLVARP
jgi:chorismate mutase / prephenate dehydrogenase